MDGANVRLRRTPAAGAAWMGGAFGYRRFWFTTEAGHESRVAPAQLTSRRSEPMVVNHPRP